MSMNIVSPQPSTPDERRIFRKVVRLARHTGYFVPSIRWRRCHMIEPTEKSPHGDHAYTDTTVYTGPGAPRPCGKVTIWIADRAVNDRALVDACVHEVAHAIASQMVDSTRWEDGHIATWGVVYASLVRQLDNGYDIE